MEDEEPIGRAELQEVPLSYLSYRTFSHPIVMDRLMRLDVFGQRPTFGAHVMDVRDCNYVEIDSERVLEGPMRAAYCQECNVFFYAFDPVRKQEELSELERLFKL